MKNEIKPSDLNVGDIVLYPPHKGDWLAQAIALLTNGTVNHAAIYYGVKDGKHYVVESVLQGLGINPLPDKIENEYPLRIFRHNNRDIDILKIIDAANYYLAESNKYPYANLGILALLLITKKFSKPTLKSKILYSVLLILAEKLMKYLQSIPAHKHPMSCSQFTAQCFTDAGNEYDLVFSDLIVSLNLLTNEAVDSIDAKMSLLDISDTIEKNNICLSIDSPILENTISTEQNMLDAIYQLIKGDVDDQHIITAIDNRNHLNENQVDKLIIEKSKDMIMAISVLMTDSKPLNILDAISVIRNSTNRNFLVTPEDININCTNISFVGSLSY